MQNDALLGFLNVLFATGDLDLSLLVHDLLLLAGDFLVPVVMLVQEVDLHTKRVTKLIDTRPLRTDNPTDEFLTDFEFDRLKIDPWVSTHDHDLLNKKRLT